MRISDWNSDMCSSDLIVVAPQLALGNDIRSRPPGFAGSFGDQKSQGFAGCEGGRCTRTEPCFDDLAGFDDSMTVTNRDRGSRFHSAADGKEIGRAHV